MFRQLTQRYVKKPKQTKVGTSEYQSIKKTPLPTKGGEIKKSLSNTFGDTLDLVIEDIEIGNRYGLVIYLSSMADGNLIADKIIHPIIEQKQGMMNVEGSWDWDAFRMDLFSGSQNEFIEYEEEVTQDLLEGQTILFLEGMNKAISLKAKSTEHRGIEEPTTQTVVRGPKDGFVEDIDTNTSLIRRRIKNAALRFEKFSIGSETSTTVYLGYMDGIINDDILNEVRLRLNDIDTNAILESANIEEFIADKTLTPFPMIYNTERPDILCGHLLEGKAIVLVDGSPFALSMPVVFSNFMSISEDYVQPFMMGTFIRVLRYVCFLITLLLPSFYVGVTSYHHEMIPTDMLISIASQREGIPFPVVVEALLMELTFEILREAGVRMPRAVGGTISIVGGLVIGQAAVEAGVVSNFMVIVVALTAIANFVTPTYSFAVGARLMRFLFILLASAFGLFGIFLGIIFLVGHLTSLRSFGVPYLAPFAPFFYKDHNDIFIRLPYWTMKQRPTAMRSKKPFKQPNAKSPTPPVKRRVQK